VVKLCSTTEQMPSLVPSMNGEVPFEEKAFFSFDQRSKAFQKNYFFCHLKSNGFRHMWPLLFRAAMLIMH
jgi:hypothetical protein